MTLTLTSQNNEPPLVLLNAPIMTADGVYTLRELELCQARDLVSTRGFESAIGHEATAKLVSELLGIRCPMRRVTYRQQPGQTALVLRLGRRMEEGKVLSNRAELEEAGFSFAVLTRME